MLETVVAGNQVLLLWHDPSQIEDLESQVSQLKTKGASVAVENADRLRLSAHSPSSFDVVLSSTHPHSLLHSEDILAEIAKVLKPNGRFLLKESVPSPRSSTEALISSLTLSGFINPSVLSSTNTSSSTQQCTVAIECRKPSFEVGASSALKLNIKKKKKDAATKSAIWSLDADDIRDADVDIINPDSLLDESDYIKPDPLSLKYDCGTNKAGKKKACKNCVCGLAEELEAGEPVTTRTAASACGSCYLGDAFRCASCPYLGMPAFKPGEKIALTDRQLKGDV